MSQTVDGYCSETRITDQDLFIGSSRRVPVVYCLDVLIQQRQYFRKSGKETVRIFPYGFLIHSQYRHLFSQDLFNVFQDLFAAHAELEEIREKQTL